MSVCSRRVLQPSDSFSPRVDAHSRKLAEAIYEQTRGLGPTALQGRLNYLHQLGKITIRDRQTSLEKLPQQREDIEFAVSLTLFTLCLASKQCGKSLGFTMWMV